MDAEELAKLVLDENDSKRIEFDAEEKIYSDRFKGISFRGADRKISKPHPVFSKPREVWEKILTTETFKNVSVQERNKLLLLFPGKKEKGNTIEEL